MYYEHVLFTRFFLINVGEKIGKCFRFPFFFALYTSLKDYANTLAKGDPCCILLQLRSHSLVSWSVQISCCIPFSTKSEISSSNYPNAARFLALWDVSRLGSCCVPPAIPDHCFCSIPRSHPDMDDVFSDIWHFCRSFLNGILFLLSLSLMLFEQFFLKSLTGSSVFPLCSFFWASHPLLEAQ